MKTLTIVLLGFAGLLPATCSKTSDKEQSEIAAPAKVIDTMPCRTDVALYGPAIIVVKGQPRVAKA